MRCACCNRQINPLHAHASGGRFFGPVCAIRLQLVRPAPKLKRKPSRFAVFRAVQAVKVDEGQDELFSTGC